MNDLATLLTALGTLVGGIGTTISVLVVAFRKSSKEREQAAEHSKHLASTEDRQNAALLEILERLEHIEAAKDD